MPEWVLKTEIPSRITLAADARLTETSFTNDQIWEFVSNRGEPVGLSIETTYGLRARSQRLFPRFWQADKVVAASTEFQSSVMVQEYYPNHLKLSFSPFDSIEVSLTYWVPNSQSIGCRIIIKNISKKIQQIKIEWIAILLPNDPGERMSVAEISNATILRGKSGGLEPVLFASGGAIPSNGSFPGLSQTYDLKPRQTEESKIVIASLATHSDSFELAQTIAKKNWQAEATRIKMMNTDRIQILTGNMDWNHNIDLSQTIAASLLISPSTISPKINCVLSRRPDHGFSMRGDGSDYNYLWNGITALQVFFFTEELLPLHIDICKNLLNNFLSSQHEDGFIDWKPSSHVSQPRRIAATPILSTLALSIYEKTEDLDFLVKNYPKLRLFIDYWFSPINDVDKDGIPEWRHVFQTGFEENILFNCWRERTEGVDITTVESPDLCSILYMECNALIKIAELIGATDVDDLREKTALLKTRAEDSWQDMDHSYHYWDRDSHTSQEAQLLATRREAGDFLIQQSFDIPVRLQIKFHRLNENTRKISIFIHGNNLLGDRRIERIDPDQFIWNSDRGFATSEKTYIHLEKIVVEGLLEDDQVTIQTVNHTWLDQTLLLPLWSGISSPKHASELVQNTLFETQKFLSSHGIACFPQSFSDENAEIHIPYNALIIKGLVKYGYRKQACELISRIMDKLAYQIRTEGFFRYTYDSKTGQGKGEKNTLDGLVPLGAFLNVLGVQIYNPWKIKISGNNPFPWPVTVKYCGTTILRKLKGTTIIFPDGQNVNFEEDEPHLVALEPHQEGAIPEKEKP